MKTLIVSAGGQNSRIKEFLIKQHHGDPKHTLKLPTANGCNTIMDEVIKRAETFFDNIIVEANSQNIMFLQPLFYKYIHTQTVVDEICSGPLGPQIRALLKTKERVYGCTGDQFHPKFSWKEFEKFHESHYKPITILASKSVPMPKGATFKVNSQGVITSWVRVDCSTKSDLINIGCYIIDPLPQIISALEKVTFHKEDIFFDLFINNNYVCGYDPGGLGFNINLAETYTKMLEESPNWI